MPALDLVQQQMDEEARRRALMEYAEGMDVGPVPADALAEAPDDLATLAPASSRVAVARGAPQAPEAAADPYGDALAEAARRRFSHTGSNLGRGIIKAFTGVSDDSGQADRAAFEQAPVVEYLQRQKMADEKRRLGLAEQKAIPKAAKPGKSTDPKSAESKAAQARLAPIVGDQLTADEISTISEAQEQLYLDAVAKKRGAEVTREGQVGLDKRAQSTNLQRAQQFAAREGREWAKMSQAERLAAMRATEKDETQTTARETELRKELMGNPTVKAWQDSKVSLAKVKAGAAMDSAAGDISMIYAVMKAYDPGSTVREGEFATAQNAGGIPQRMLAVYNKAISGERLTPVARADFLKSAEAAHAATESAAQKVIHGFTSSATARGLNARDVFPLDLDLTAPAPAPGATAPKAPDPRNVVNTWDEGGKRYHQYADGHVEVDE